MFVDGPHNLVSYLVLSSISLRTVSKSTHLF